MTGNAAVLAQSPHHHIRASPKSTGKAKKQTRFLWSLLLPTFSAHPQLGATNFSVGVCAPL